MEEGKELNGNSNSRSVERDEVYSRPVRAGKRTYFFDVKATRNNEYYLTITESKKRFNKDGRYFFEKHKIFLYKEDFEKFKDGLVDVLSFIENSNQAVEEVEEVLENDAVVDSKEFTDVEFEDLEVGAEAETIRSE